MRQRTRGEIMRGLQSTRGEQESRRRRPWVILASVLACATAGWVAYRYGPLLRQMAAAPSPAPEQTAPPSLPAPEAAAPEQTAPLSLPAPEAAAPEPVYTMRPPPNRPQLDADTWLVRGEVYDLLSLKPVSGARITFTSRADGKSRAARSDAKGRYRLKLPKLKEGGYDAAVSHPAYRPIFLEEMAPPYSSQKASRREDAANTAVTSQILHVPFLPEHADDEAEYGLILLPLQ